MSDPGPVSIRAIGTAVPPTSISQRAFADLLAGQPGLSRLGQRRVRACFDASAIETRYTVLPELDGTPGAHDPLLYDAAGGRVLTPTTGARNAVYVREAPELFLAAAKQAIAGAPGLAPDDISHVVTVSCTGFFAPGPDYLLVRQLGLKPSTERFHLGFMGCYGAFPALRTARSICRADPEAVVLVVCAELCSIHLHAADDLDTVVASSLFGDGAAAALVSARPARCGDEVPPRSVPPRSVPPRTVLSIDSLHTTLTTDGQDDMTWTIGDQGFDMVLSSYVPRLLEAQLPAALAPLLGDAALPTAPQAIRHWAVHPGGRSILDRVQGALGLSDAQLAPSREVLRRYGNMSSATVLFVLQALLESPAPVAPERVCAMAFGPGLTVEAGLFTREPAA